MTPNTVYTVECHTCGFSTDLNILSETNPRWCPECGEPLFLTGTDIEWKYIHDPVFMNVHTGSTDHYDGWWYENEDGEEVNAVDREEVVCVYKNENDEWIEFSV